MKNMPNLSANAMPLIKKRLHVKAAQSCSKIHISAIAFDKRGKFVAQTFNSFREGLSTHRGGGAHAEQKLMKKYGAIIKTILIARIGHNNTDNKHVSGQWRPISPCSACVAIAQKLGIKIITIDECK